MRRVSDIMSPTVNTIHRDKLVCEVEGFFVANDISGAPLVDDDGKMIGVITKSDVNRFNFTDGDPSYARAYEIATPNVITVSASAPVREAAHQILDAHVHHLIVVDGSDMIGMLSTFDFVKLALMD